MEHEMRKEINKFKDFLNENSEEKLNISDVSSRFQDYEYMGNRFIQSIMDTGWDLTSEEQNLLFDKYIQSLKENDYTTVACNNSAIN
jgi:hypothetical protein